MPNEDRSRASDAEGDAQLIDDPWMTERAIVLQVLRTDHPARWTRAELQAEIYDVDPAAIRRALRRLKTHGVICLEGKELWASLCTWRLEDLGMVSI
jgi:hypothetical protein